MTESGFDLGFDDASRGGVYFVTDDDLPTLEVVARDAGLTPHRIDLAACENKAMLLLRVATALDFPAGAGRNWDSLADALKDLSWLPGDGGHAILFDRADDLRDASEPDFDTLLELLDVASKAWIGAGVPFFVFLALPESDFDGQDDEDDEDDDGEDDESGDFDDGDEETLGDDDSFPDEPDRNGDGDTRPPPPAARHRGTLH